MGRKLLLIIFILYTTIAQAATIKTDVVVIGNGAGAAAAAIQSARSRLKTVLLMKGEWLESIQQKRIMTDQFFNRSFHKMDSAGFYFIKEPSNRVSRDEFAGVLVSDLKKRADTLRFLSIKLRSDYTDVEKDGTGWKVVAVVDGIKTTFKAKVLIDATEKGEVVIKVGADFPPSYAEWQKQAGPLMYRTVIASGISSKAPKGPEGSYPPSPAFYIPLGAVVAKNATNLFIVDKALAIDENTTLPAEVSLGEGVGAAAAYCAFFKTTTKDLRVRVIQIELMDFGTYLLPFSDLKNTDPYYRSIQQIGGTGLLKGVIKPGTGSQIEFAFMPDEPVKTEEIKPVLTEIYSRAFLWLAREKPGEHFTTANLLSLISEITLSEPKDFVQSTQRAWKTDYKFTSDFDLKRPVTRREFAILANKYLAPFGRAVDMSGRIVN